MNCYTFSFFLITLISPASLQVISVLSVHQQAMTEPGGCWEPLVKVVEACLSVRLQAVISRRVLSCLNEQNPSRRRVPAFQAFLWQSSPTPSAVCKDPTTMGLSPPHMCLAPCCTKFARCIVCVGDYSSHLQWIYKIFHKVSRFAWLPCTIFGI